MNELRVLTLPNGVTIKFEEIIFLAGDIYGLPKQPIIDPFREEDQEDSWSLSLLVSWTLGYRSF